MDRLIHLSSPHMCNDLLLQSQLPIFLALLPLHTLAQRLETSLGQKYLLLRGTIDVLEYRPREVHKLDTHAADSLEWAWYRSSETLQIA
jgi:hypothetical protein